MGIIPLLLPALIFLYFTFRGDPKIPYEDMQDGNVRFFCHVINCFSLGFATSSVLAILFRVPGISWLEMVFAIFCASMAMAYKIIMTFSPKGFRMPSMREILRYWGK